MPDPTQSPDPTPSPSPASTAPTRPARPSTHSTSSAVKAAKLARASKPAASSAAPKPGGSKPGAPKPGAPKSGAPKSGAATEAAAPKPELSDADRARGRAIGLALVGAAAIVALVVTIGIFLPALGTLAGGGVRPVDAAALPETIAVCDREYTRADGTLLTLDGARAAVGGEPVIVGVNGGCPENVCGRNGACLATVFVQTTDDRYAAYSAGDGT